MLLRYCGCTYVEDSISQNVAPLNVTCHTYANNERGKNRYNSISLSIINMRETTKNDSSFLNTYKCSDVSYNVTVSV